MIKVKELIERLKMHDPESFVGAKVYMQIPVEAPPQSVLLKVYKNLETLDNSIPIYRFTYLAESKKTTQAEIEEEIKGENL